MSCGRLVLMASNREGVKTLSPGAQQLCGRPEVLVVAAARISLGWSPEVRQPIKALVTIH
jgi:hypothetical protein